MLEVIGDVGSICVSVACFVGFFLKFNSFCQPEVRVVWIDLWPFAIAACVQSVGSTETFARSWNVAFVDMGSYTYLQEPRRKNNPISPVTFDPQGVRTIQTRHGPPSWLQSQTRPRVSDDHRTKKPNIQSWSPCISFQPLQHKGSKIHTTFSILVEGERVHMSAEIGVGHFIQWQFRCFVDILRFYVTHNVNHWGSVIYRVRVRRAGARNG